MVKNPSYCNGICTYLWAICLILLLWCIFLFSVLDELLSCQTIKITLKNEVLTNHGQFQGIYEISAPVNGKPSWTSQSSAIWYIPDYNMWTIGNLNDIGKSFGVIYITGMLLGANEIGKWKHIQGKMLTKIDIDDFCIECIARKGTIQQQLIQIHTFRFLQRKLYVFV